MCLQHGLPSRTDTHTHTHYPLYFTNGFAYAAPWLQSKGPTTKVFLKASTKASRRTCQTPNIPFVDGQHVPTAKSTLRRINPPSPQKTFGLGTLTIVATVPKAVGIWPAIWMVPQVLPRGVC